MHWFASFVHVIWSAILFDRFCSQLSTKLLKATNILHHEEYEPLVEPYLGHILQGKWFHYWTRLQLTLSWKSTRTNLWAKFEFEYLPHTPHQTLIKFKELHLPEANSYRELPVTALSPILHTHGFLTIQVNLKQLFRNRCNQAGKIAISRFPCDNTLRYGWELTARKWGALTQNNDHHASFSIAKANLYTVQCRITVWPQIAEDRKVAYGNR